MYVYNMHDRIEVLVYTLSRMSAILTMSLPNVWSFKLAVCTILAALISVTESQVTTVTPELSIDNSTKLEGSRVQIQCHLSGLPKNDMSYTVLIEQEAEQGSVFWVRDGALTNPDGDGDPSASVDDQGVVEERPIVHILTFNAINRTNAGIYKCTVIRLHSTGAGGALGADIIASDSIDLEVFHLPPRQFPICSSSSDNLQFVIGDIIELECHSEDSGNLPFSLIWTREDADSQDGLDQILTRTMGKINSALTIVATEVYDGATFMCKMQGSPITDVGRQCPIGPVLVMSPSTPSITINHETRRPIDPTPYSSSDLFPVDIIGISLPGFVMLVTGVGLFVLLSLILCMIYCCRLYHCSCAISRRSLTGSNRGHYDVSTRRRSTKTATNDFWMEPGPIRTSSLRPEGSEKRIAPIKPSDSDEPLGDTEIPLSVYPPPLPRVPPSYQLPAVSQPDVIHYSTSTVSTAIPNPTYSSEQDVLTVESSDHTKLPISVIGDEGLLYQDADSTVQLPYASTTIIGSIPDDKSVGNCNTRIAYENTQATHVESCTSHGDPSNSPHSNIHALSKTETNHDVRRAKKAEHRISKEFPVYAVPNKNKLKRSSSVSFMSKPLTVSKPLYEPPPPPPPSFPPPPPPTASASNHPPPPPPLRASASNHPPPHPLTQTASDLDDYPLPPPPPVSASDWNNYPTPPSLPLFPSHSNDHYPPPPPLPVPTSDSNDHNLHSPSPPTLSIPDESSGPEPEGRRKTQVVIGYSSDAVGYATVGVQ